MNAMTQARGQGGVTHVFRPGLFRQPRTYSLDGNVLHWRVGTRTGRLALADIASMRLNLAEGTGAAARCLLVETSGRVHKLSDLYWPRWVQGERCRWARVQRREETFRALAFALARRLRAANPDAVLTTGPGRTEWIATCIVALLGALVILVGSALMVVHSRFELHIAAFMGLAAIYLPMLWPVIRSGVARPLDPGSLPDLDPQDWVEW